MTEHVVDFSCLSLGTLARMYLDVVDLFFEDMIDARMEREIREYVLDKHLFSSYYSKCHRKKVAAYWKNCIEPVDPAIWAFWQSRV